MAKDNSEISHFNNPIKKVKIHSAVKDMDDAGKLLVNYLIEAYENQHEIYVNKQRFILSDYGWNIIGGSCSLIAIILGLIINSLIFMIPLGAFFLILSIINYFRTYYGINREKEILEQLKSALEGVGLRIACKAIEEYPFKKLCIMKDGKTKEGYFFLPKTDEIDFDKYNRIFEI